MNTENNIRAWERVGAAHARVLDAILSIRIRRARNPELAEIGFFDDILENLKAADAILVTAHEDEGRCPADSCYGKAVSA